MSADLDYISHSLFLWADTFFMRAEIKFGKKVHLKTFKRYNVKDRGSSRRKSICSGPNLCASCSLPSMYTRYSIDRNLSCATSFYRWSYNVNCTASEPLNVVDFGKLISTKSSLYANGDLPPSDGTEQWSPRAPRHLRFRSVRKSRSKCIRRRRIDVYSGLKRQNKRALSIGLLLASPIDHGQAIQSSL